MLHNRADIRVVVFKQNSKLKSAQGFSAQGNSYTIAIRPHILGSELGEIVAWVWLPNFIVGNVYWFAKNKKKGIGKDPQILGSQDAQPGM